MTESLGPPSSRRLLGEAGQAATLVLDWPGQGEPVLVLAHYDTVWPLGTSAVMPFAVDGDIVRGPGVFDMKAGLVQAVWAVKSLLHHNVTCPPIRMVLNVTKRPAASVPAPSSSEPAVAQWPPWSSREVRTVP